LGAEKADPRLRSKKFWNFRPYSRVLRNHSQKKRASFRKALVQYFFNLGLEVGWNSS
jgi:hypothetical protein